MNSGQVSPSSTSAEPDANANEPLEMDQQDVQPESGTVREDDIRQSSAASDRVNDKNMEAPEEA